MLGHAPRKTGVEQDVGIRVDHAQTVRANQRDVVFTRYLRRPTFQRRALGPDFLESGGNNHGSAYALLAAFLENARHRGGRNHDQGEVDFVGNFAHGCVRMHPGN